MSFIDDIVDIGSSVAGVFTGSGIGPTLARTAALGLILNQVNSSINKENSKPDAANSSRPDTYSRLQQSPDTTHAIPVVYGTTFLGGIITDAVLTNNNQTMYFCMTICEMTGNLMSTGDPSEISFKEIYLDGAKVTFESDGITLASVTDDDGNTSTELAGLIEIYCFSGNSTSPVVPEGYTNGALNSAYAIMPNWTSTYTMDDLVFVIVKVDYDREHNSTGLGTLEFKISNTLTQPGDCVYDYMTNTRYGAGISSTEIYDV